MLRRDRRSAGECATRRAGKAVHVLGRDESRKNVADSFYQIAPNASMIVVLQKAPQTAMADAPDNHLV